MLFLVFVPLNTVRPVRSLRSCFLWQVTNAEVPLVSASSCSPAEGASEHLSVHALRFTVLCCSLFFAVPRHYELIAPGEPRETLPQKTCMMPSRHWSFRSLREQLKVAVLQFLSGPQFRLLLITRS